MIDPLIVNTQNKLIILVHDQTQWEELQAYLIAKGCSHREAKFDYARPCRWVRAKGNGRDLEWWKGQKEFVGDYPDHTVLDFDDICINEFTFDPKAIDDMF